jgi:hypothetical protein
MTHSTGDKTMSHKNAAVKSINLLAALLISLISATSLPV